MDSLVAVNRPDGDMEINPIQIVYLKRWLKETPSSKSWYAFCEVWKEIGGNVPDWAWNLVTTLQKGLVSISD